MANRHLVQVPLHGGMKVPGACLINCRSVAQSFLASACQGTHCRLILASRHAFAGRVHPVGRQLLLQLCLQLGLRQTQERVERACWLASIVSLLAEHLGHQMGLVCVLAHDLGFKRL